MAAPNNNNHSNDFEEIFNRYRYTPDVVIRSRAWYDQLTRQLASTHINERDLFNKANTDSRIYPGKFYMYFYDPKHKATLPYYDRFPLTVPYKALPDGFIGLNFHYLGYYQRIKLLTAMMKFATGPLSSEHTRLQYTWSMVSHIAQAPLVKHCVKRYLFGHVQSKFIEIRPSDWHTAMFLPVARFVGKNQHNIWAENSRF